MSTKIGIKKISILVLCLMFAVLLAACAKAKPTVTVTTETWSGNQTLDKVLTTIGGVQSGGAKQTTFSIDSRFEASAGINKYAFKIQAQFDVDPDDSVKVDNQLLVEITDLTPDAISGTPSFELVAGLYALNDSIFVSAGQFNFNLNKIDILTALGKTASGFFDLDVAGVLGSLDIGLDISSILGSLLFPSASVVTSSPARGQNGTTLVTVEAQVDIDTLLSVVVGAFGLVKDTVLDATKDTNPIDLNVLFLELTQKPLVSEIEKVKAIDATGAPYTYERVTTLGYDYIIAELIGLKVEIADGVYEDRAPFAGSSLSLTYINGSLIGAELNGKYAKQGSNSVDFNFTLQQINVSTRVINVELPPFIQTFDIYSLRLTGEGEIPDVGEIDIRVDIRLDPKVKERNQIVIDVFKKGTDERVIAAYYDDGSIYLDLTAVDISYIHLNAEKLGIGKIRIGGLDLQKIMNDLVGDLEYFAEEVSAESANASTLLAGAVYDLSGASAYADSADGEFKLTIDVDYLINLFINSIGASDGRIYIDITSDTIISLLDSLGLTEVLDDVGEDLKPVYDEILAELPEDIQGILEGVTEKVDEMLENLGETVISFLNAADFDLKLSALFNESKAPGVGIELGLGGNKVGHIDLFIKKIGDGEAVYDMPDDLKTAYKNFDYSTISFNGIAQLASLGAVNYRLTISGLDLLPDTGALSLSLLTYDRFGGVLFGVYFHDNTLYVDFGNEIRVLGFSLADLNLSRIKIDLGDDNTVQGHIAATFAEAIDDTGSGTGGETAAESGLTLAEILELLDIVAFDKETGRSSVALSNDSFVELLSELIGAELIGYIKDFLPPVSVGAYADIYDLLFSVEFNYFEESIGIVADLTSLYFGTDAAKNITTAVKVPDDEKSTYIDVNDLLSVITVSGDADLFGKNLSDPNLRYELTLINPLDLGSLEFSLEVMTASSPLFAVYYDAAATMLYVDLGLTNIFGFDLLSMNISKIAIPFDLADLLGVKTAGGTQQSYTVGALATADDSGVQFGLADIFALINGEYKDGVITINSNYQNIVALIGDAVGDEVMKYLEDILPPITFGALFNANSGELGLSFGIALETLGFNIKSVALGEGTLKRAVAAQYSELSIDGLLENIVVSGAGELPGLGDMTYTLTITGITALETFRVSFETVDAYGQKDFSFYYVGADETAYVDFGSLKVFALDFEAFNIRQLKLTNIKLDLSQVFAGVTTKDESMAVSADDPAADLLDKLIGSIVGGYDDATGKITVEILKESVAEVILGLLTEEIYDKIGALIPGIGATFGWATDAGEVNIGLAAYNANGDKITGLEIGVDAFFFGVSDTKGEAAFPKASGYLTLEQIFGDIQIKGTGTIPGAGEVYIDINMRIDLETTSDAEFSLVAKNIIGEQLFGIFNFGSEVYIDLTGLYFGEINADRLFGSKIKLTGINIADIIAGIAGPLVGSLADVGSENQLAESGSGDGDLGASADVTFDDIFNNLNAVFGALSGSVNITPTSITNMLEILLGYNLGLLVEQLGPNLKVGFNFMDILGVGFDIGLNYTDASGTATVNPFIGFKLTGITFGYSERYFDKITSDEAYTNLADLVDNATIHGAVEAEIAVELLGDSESQDGLNNFINALLGAITVGEETTYGALGKVSVNYNAGAKLTYALKADLTIDRASIYNTDLLIELWARTRDGLGMLTSERLVFGFYVDDGIGFIDMSGLVGASDYSNGKGLRLAINEINIHKLLSSLLPTSSDLFGGEELSDAAAAKIQINLTNELLASLLEMMGRAPEEGDESILSLSDVVFDLEDFTAKGVMTAFSTNGNPQVRLTFNANLDLTKDGAVDFGAFGANKGKFVLINAKYGLGDFAGLLSIIDNTLQSTDGASADMFVGTLLVQNRESIKNGRPDSVNGAVYSDGTTPVADGQTSNIYIYKIRSGNNTSSSGDPLSDKFKNNDATNALNGQLGILLDVTYNFTVKVPDIHLYNSATGFSTMGLAGELGWAYAMGDMDMAYFFALGETGLSVMARIGGDIKVSVSLQGLAASFTSAPAIDPITLYTFIPLATVDTINLRNIVGGIALEGAAAGLLGQAEGETEETETKDPFVTSTDIVINASGSDLTTILSINLNAFALKAGLEGFQNELLGGLAPGTTFDVGNPVGDRYVADAVWNGVSAMIIG
ncbi:MAG: hypothetical protein LBQ40_05740, partial [Clostridiales bacterium]|nr:hypothetical protein [Clostridiales bacterium]